MHIDLRIFGIDNVTDFGFICNVSHVTLYLICALPVYSEKEVLAFENKFFEVRLSAAFLQKIRTVENYLDITPKMKIKDHILSYPVLPKVRI